MRSGESARRGIVLWILGVLGAIEPQKAIPLLPTALLYPADVAESVDATDLKSVSRKGVRVRSPPSAPFIDSARGARRRARAATGETIDRRSTNVWRDGTFWYHECGATGRCARMSVSANLSELDRWQRMADLDSALLADIAAGRTVSHFRPEEIARIEARRDRARRRIAAIAALLEDVP